MTPSPRLKQFALEVHSRKAHRGPQTRIILLPSSVNPSPETYDFLDKQRIQCTPVSAIALVHRAMFGSEQNVTNREENARLGFYPLLGEVLFPHRLYPWPTHRSTRSNRLITHLPASAGTKTAAPAVVLPV